MLFSTHFWAFCLGWAAMTGVATYVLVRLVDFLPTKKFRRAAQVAHVTGGTAVGESEAATSGEADSEESAGVAEEQLVPKGSDPRGAGVLAFLGSLLALRFIMYYQMPSFQGPWWGYGVILLAVVIPVGVFSLMGAARTLRVVLIFLLLLLLTAGYPALLYCYEGVGPYNGHRLADLPQIKTAAEEAKIPPSDPSHLVMVSRSIAHFKGQAVLGQLGSKYELKPEAWTLQAVQKHRYWVAPLTLHNFGDTLNIDDPESPGYIIVDAENPEVDAVLKDGFHIKLFDDQQWGLFLKRYIYVNGFTDGIIDSPYFEVDDNWQPHWVVAFVKRPFGGMAGHVVEKVVVVNVAEREPKIEVYDPNNSAERKRFSWVDRVMTRNLVTEYATDWGWYHGQFAHDNPWKVWFGYDKTGTRMPDEVELCYTVGGENIWVAPMTSTNTRDHTCLGVLVFETNRNEGTFYPGLKGFNVGSSVRETMLQARDNIKHYPVGHIQLMSIFGELTWVAIYEAPQSKGSSFGGIGLLHAHGQNAGDVVFATDRHSALSRYQVHLSSRQDGSEKVSRTATASKEVKARVLRIAALPSAGSLDGQILFQFRVVGDNRHVFLVQRSVYPQIALVKEGDEVTFTYIEPGNEASEIGIKEVPIQSLRCQVLDQ